MPRLITGLALIAAALTLAGCGSTGGGHAASGLALEGTPLDRHQIGVERATEMLEVPLDADFSTLRVGDRASVERFVGAYRDRGQGQLVLIMPENMPSPQLAIEAMKEVRAIAWSQGVPYESMRGEVYDAGGAMAPLVVAFDVYDVVAPACKSIAAYDLADVSSNNELGYFGCSVRYNIAQMIADPSDLLGQRELGPRDARRLETIMQAYRAGAPKGALGGQEAVGVAEAGGD